jgi:peptide/nickel transport system permease protein
MARVERKVTVTSAAADASRTVTPVSGYLRCWRSVDPLGRAGLVIVALLTFLALTGSWLVPHDPYKMDITRQLQPPSWSHPFGTDRYGRDVLSRVIAGTRVSLSIALVAVGCALAIGASLGLVAGYAGGYLDLALSRLMDILLGFPSLLLAIAIAGTLGPGISNGIIAIIVVYIPFFFRVSRAPVLSEREREYVEAARCIGLSEARIAVRHVVPNVLGPILVQTAVTLAFALLTEASLSFLGLGAQPPQPAWGAILNEGRVSIERAPWISVFPGLAIMLAVFGLNLAGDGLRDVLDPRLRNR